MTIRVWLEVTLTIAWIRLTTRLGTDSTGPR